jgi:hypothetical protein
LLRPDARVAGPLQDPDGCPCDTKRDDQAQDRQAHDQPVISTRTASVVVLLITLAPGSATRGRFPIPLRPGRRPAPLASICLNGISGVLFRELDVERFVLGQHGVKYRFLGLLRLDLEPLATPVTADLLAHQIIPYEVLGATVRTGALRRHDELPEVRRPRLDTSADRSITPTSDSQGKTGPPGSLT